MQENYAAEIKSLTQYLLQHPESLLFARLAERYLLMNEVDKALEICQRGLRYHPNYATGHFILAKCYLARKQFDEAERRLKHVYTLESNFVNAYKLYGELMGSVGRSELQYASFKQIKRIDPLAPIELPVVTDKPEVTQPSQVTETMTPKPSPLDDLQLEPPEAQRPLSPVIDIPEEEDTIPDFSSSNLFEERPQGGFPEAEAIADVDMHPPVRQPQATIMEPETTARVDDSELGEADAADFEKEEERFSLILDDLFRPNLAEEEQREQDARDRLERAARSQSTAQPKKPSFPEAAEQTFRPMTPPQSARPVSGERWPQTPTSGAEPADRAPERPPLQPPQQKESPARPVTGERWPQTPTSGAEPAEFAPARPPLQKRTPLTKEPDLPPATVKKAADEAEDSPLPTYGPDFSVFPHKDEDEEINEFIDHLERMGSGASLERELPAEPKPISRQDDQPPREEPLESETNFSDDAASERTKEKFVTPTLGEIYAAQGQYAKAINVFELLLKKNPENDWYRTKLEYLRKRLQEEKK